MDASANHRRKLIRLLQRACSGELAAGYAYRGHWRSVRDAAQRARIREIERDEWHHRALVIDLLHRLDARPRAILEAIYWLIGKSIGIFCFVGGWFAPMYGAGRLERINIVEYEDAAFHALHCGHPEMIDCLLTMAEVEWEHERFFREVITGHPLLRLFPVWNPPPRKESIRARYGAQAAAA